MQSFTKEQILQKVSFLPTGYNPSQCWLNYRIDGCTHIWMQRQGYSVSS